MANTNINGVDITYNPAGAQSANIVAGVEHFMNEMVVEQQSAPPTSALMHFDTITQAGHQVLPYFDQKHNSPREFTNNGGETLNFTDPVSDVRQVDQEFVADGTQARRIKGAYRVFDAGWRINDDEMNQSQWDISRSIARRISQLKSRLEVQIILDALNAVPASQPGDDTTLNSTLDPTIRWDVANRRRTSGGNTAYGWNFQKVKVAQRNLAQAGLAPAGACVFADNMTVDGFASDEQSVNADYTGFAGIWQGSGMYTMPEEQKFGWDWIILPEFPNQKNGTQGGISVVSAPGSVTGNVTNEYVVSKNAVKLIVSAEMPMFQTQIKHSFEKNATLYRFRAYLGAMVVYPKGIVKVQNAVSNDITS